MKITYTSLVVFSRILMLTRAPHKYMYLHVYTCVYRVSGALQGPLARYVKLRFEHAPGMPGTFSTPPRVSDPDMHHGTRVTHVP